MSDRTQTTDEAMTRPRILPLPGLPAPALFVLAALLGATVLAAASARALEMQTPARHAVLLDYDTGAILLEKDADTPMPPASMSKLMTVFMLFERLKDGRLDLEDSFPISKKAWKMGGSKMFVEVGKHATIADLLRGIIVQSGNDACIVVAEGIAGSEEAFAEAMTRRAAEIGLTQSSFRNASGWPAPGHHMSARDLASLAVRIIRDHGELYPLFSERSFTYSGIKQGNRNPLLYKNLGADGLKTGHTEESGYGLVASAARADRRLVLVVNGLESVNQRSRESERLLEWGFRQFKNYALYTAGEAVAEARVWLGEYSAVPLLIDRDLVVTLPRTARKDLDVRVVYDGPVPAPVRKGDRIAELQISAPGMSPRRVPLTAGRDVARLGFFGRLTSMLLHRVTGTAD